MQMQEIVATFFKSFWDSLFEHILLPLFWRPIMCIRSALRKRRAIKNGTWPYFVEAEVVNSREYNAAIYSLKMEIRVYITPIAHEVYIHSLVIEKEGGISEIDAWFAEADDSGLIPLRSTKIDESSKNFAVKKIDEYIRKTYLTSETFNIPCELGERPIVKVGVLGSFEGKPCHQFSKPIKGSGYHGKL